MNSYTYWIGADIGQASDPTAIALLEKRFPPRPPDTQPIRGDGRAQAAAAAKPISPVYVVKYLERVRLHTSYPAVVERLGQMLRDPQLDGPAKLVVDGTGVGRAIVDMLREAGLNPLAISIHGGDTVSHEGFYTHVPKRDLAGIVRKLLDTERLKVIESLPEARTLRHELQNFKVKINPETAHDSYSAWREGDHDDLVLAVAVAAWAAERVGTLQHVARPRILGAQRDAPPPSMYIRWPR